MSITRVKPAGWAVNEKLTSAQQTQVDINAASALDKRAGQTDTLSSAITVASGASISMSAGSTLASSGTVNILSSYSFGLLSTGNLFGALTATSTSVVNLNGIVTTNLSETSDFTLQLATRTTDSAIHNIFIKGQAPYASATTNVFAGNIFLDLQGGLATATIPASVSIRDSLDLMLQIKRSAVKANNPGAANGVVMTTGTGIGMSLSTGDNTSGPGLNAAGITIQPGTGTNLCGNVAILGGQALANGATPGHITIQGGTGVNVSGSGGNASYVTINGGLALNASNTAGDVNINGGTAVGGSNSNGGSVNIQGGQATNQSGSVNLQGGTGYNGVFSTGLPGDVNITGGTPAGIASQTGGKVVINGGSPTGASSTGGAVVIQGGLATTAGGVGGNVFVVGGTSPSGTSAGHIMISGGLGGTSRGNISLGAGASIPNFQSGQGILFINGVTLSPGSAPSGGMFMWVDLSTNTLKVQFPGGAVKTVTVS